MPVYIDNVIEDYTAKIAQANPRQAVFQSKKTIESVNHSLGKEPQRIQPVQLAGNPPINEGTPADLMRGSLISNYS